MQCFEIRGRLAIGAMAAIAAVWTTIAAAQPLPKASPESVGMSTERLGKLTAALQQEVADKRLPGAVVMVARNGKLSMRSPSVA
jgi:CubicO group peptidase (beta-lactamase class C family)